MKKLLRILVLVIAASFVVSSVQAAGLSGGNVSAKKHATARHKKAPTRHKKHAPKKKSHHARRLSTTPGTQTQPVLSASVG